MGNVVFVCKNASELENQLKRNFANRKRMKEMENNSSNPDNTSNLSFMKTSQEYKIAYDSLNC